MPKQDFSINIGTGVAGEMYGLATTNSQRLTYNAEVAMTAYGLGVIAGAKANTIKLGVPASGILLGVTMRENKLESAKRPGDGTIGIPVGQPLAVMISGPVLVTAKTAISSGVVGINANGEFGSGTGYTTMKNVTALKFPVAAGDVFPVMVNVLPVATA